MRIAIFYDEKRTQPVEILKKSIESRNCSVVMYKTADVWDEMCYKNAVTLLTDVTHVLFLITSNPFENNVFMFFSGIAVGKHLPVLILRKDKKSPLPKNCKHLAVILTVDTFEQYFSNEQKVFTERQQRENARQILLEKGYPCFDANFINAVSNNEVEIAELFLQAGFNPSLCDTRGTPVLCLAVRNSYYEMAEKLLEYGADTDLCSKDRCYSALMEAAQLGDVKTVALLLSKGAEVNIKSKDGQTALIFAAARQDEKIAEMLIKHGADWTITDHLGMSAQSYAKLFNNQTIMALMKS